MSKINWDRVQAEHKVSRSRPPILQIAFGDDCPVHYRMNCEECGAKRLLNIEWSNRKKPHLVAVSVGGICTACGLVVSNGIHSDNLAVAKREARIQYKLWKQHMDSL